MSNFSCETCGLSERCTLSEYFFEAQWNIENGVAAYDDIVDVSVNCIHYTGYFDPNESE